MTPIPVPATRGPALAAILWLLSGACHADSDEAWLHRADLPAEVQPLLALILDRSQATAATVEAGDDYDPERDYAAGLPSGTACDAAKAYLRRGTGSMPDCRRDGGIEIDPGAVGGGLQCEAARAALARSGFFVASRVAEWRDSPEGGHWQAPATESTGIVECRADRSRHGGNAGPWYAGEGLGVPWTHDPAREIRWDRPPFADPFVLFAGNYLNYLLTPPALSARPIADITAMRLAAALESTSELDVALVRVDDDGPDGGFVALAPAPSAHAATALRQLAATPPAGSAPLAETMVEAARWLGGGTRHFGVDDRTDAAALVAPGAEGYRSPFTHACRPLSLAVLSAGQASDDDRAAAAAAALPRFSDETGGCGGDCLAKLGDWLSATDLRADLPGTQSAALSWIAPSTDWVSGAARALADPLAFVDLVVTAYQRDAAVAAGPQLSAAALMPFDGRSGAPGVVYGLTAPRPRARWAGNALQYAWQAPAGALEPPRVVDRDGVPAIGADGLPRAGTQSLWSDAPDTNLLAGGAAGRLPPADARRWFADVASERLGDPDNRLEPGNARIGRDLLGLGALDPESVDGLLAAFRATRMLGDPGLRAPAIADYPRERLRVAFVATHDGLLHALDADSGAELWAWMPKALLARIPALVRDAPTTARSHGIDGPLVLHRHDPDGDGVVEPAAGEHVWLMFGLGRGGPGYHALDVSLPRDPRLMWSFELPDAGLLALAEPVLSRLTIEGSGQDAGAWIAVLAGGYDRRFDAPSEGGSGAHGAVLIVDAATGRTLWAAGDDAADLAVPGMAGIAAAPRVLDLDGDGQLDRVYAVDVAGNLWRMDFGKGRPADALASAVRIADLGGHGRRFHATPDAAVVRIGTRTRIAIALGSGSSVRPRGESTEDRIFVVYDDVAGAPGRRLALGDLHEVADPRAGIPPDAPGWTMRLDRHGAGEKVAGPATTFDHVLRFQTYQPLAADPASPCGPPRSVSRRYALDVRTAAPVNTAVESEDEEPEEIPASGIPPDLRFGFPGRWDEACAGCRPRPFGIAGGETFDTGYANDPVRTSWRKLVPPASR